MTRGKLELGDHKLAGLYRAPARRSKHRRKRMPKMPGGNRGVYFMLWRIVDGAVRDCFERHPEYLSDRGRMSAQLSITKRVVGALFGYGAQASQCRSVRMEGWGGILADALASQSKAPTDAAADMPVSSYGRFRQARTLQHVLAGALSTMMRLRRWTLIHRPKFRWPR